MPQTFPKANEIVEVIYFEWKDPSWSSDAKFSLTEIDLLVIEPISSAGVLVYEDEESITVARDFYASQREVRGLQRVLKINIIAQKRWKFRDVT